MLMCVWLGGIVLGRWTCDQQVAGSTTGRRGLGCSLGQAVHTRVPLSPSSIIWYRRKLGR